MTERMVRLTSKRKCLTHRERVGNVGGSLRRMREAGCQIRNGSRPRVKCWQGLVSDKFRFPPKFRFRARIRFKVILESYSYSGLKSGLRF